MLHPNFEPMHPRGVGICILKRDNPNRSKKAKQEEVIAKLLFQANFWNQRYENKLRIQTVYFTARADEKFALFGLRALDIHENWGIVAS